MKGRRTRRLLGVLACLLLLAAVRTTTSWTPTYWSAPATGSGSGVTGSDAPLSLSTGTPATAVYPGSSAAVAVTVTNPNRAATTIGSLSLRTGQGTNGFAVDAGHNGCTLSALSYTTQTNGGAGWSVPGRSGGVDGTLSISLPGALAMSTSAANACQGATFTVYLQAGP